MSKQLRLPMDMPITGKPYCRHVIDRIDKDAEEEVPEGHIVRTKMIYIKNLLT